MQLRALPNDLGGHAEEQHAPIHVSLRSSSIGNFLFNAKHFIGSEPGFRRTTCLSQPGKKKKEERFLS